MDHRENFPIALWHLVEVIRKKRYCDKSKLSKLIKTCGAKEGQHWIKSRQCRKDGDLQFEFGATCYHLTKKFATQIYRQYINYDKENISDVEKMLEATNE